MRTLTVGKNGRTLSRLCFNTLAIGPLLARLPLSDALDLIRFAYLQGITTFETAKDYQTRQILRAATEWGLDISVIDQAPSYTYEEAEVHLAESLSALEEDEGDIFLLSDVRSVEDWRLRQDAWRYLEEARQMGLVRAIGIRTGSVEVVRAVATVPTADIILAVFNVEGYGISDGSSSDMEQALRLAKGEGKVVGAARPLAGGMLVRDHLHRSLTFLRSHPAVDFISAEMVRKQDVETWIQLERPTREVLTPPPSPPLRLHILDRCDGCQLCVPVCPTHALFVDEGSARVINSLCDACGKCGPVCPEDALFLIPAPPSEASVQGPHQG